MSSRRFRRHYAAPTRQDSPPVSEVSSGRASTLAVSRHNGKAVDKISSTNGIQVGSSTSSSPSEAYRSETEVSSDGGSDYESFDPAVNQALLQYMVNTRKRHLKIRKEIFPRIRKLPKHRHQRSEEVPIKTRPETISTPSKIRKEAPAIKYETPGEKAHNRFEFVPHRPSGNVNAQLPVKIERSPNMSQPYFDPYRKEVFDPAPFDQRLDLPSPGRQDHLLSGDSRHIPVDPNKPPSVAIWEDCVRSIPFAHKIFVHSLKSRQTLAFKMALQCQRELEKASYRRNRPVKENQLRSKRALREMLAYWRRNEKDERESRKKAEKEALEKRKQEEDAREAKRQEKKLNFLLTQTELYGHFISKRIENPSKGDDADLAEAAPVDFSKLDFDQDDEALKEQAKLSAQQALKLQSDRTKEFDEGAQQRKREGEAELGTAPDVDQMNFQDPSTMQKDSNIEQPKMLTCQLKSYQLKGLNWLSNLYEQGINGILADEMGLGKTVQSISLLAHLAEAHNIWGPFLVIAPASTLHNWQQEMTKFAPDLKTLPYWGNVKDRKTLRKFWSQKQLYTKDAPFHVLVTSYQLILTDERYFQRIKWQYMVLDEAQAIKSSSSARWKTLMNFHCRNRLLLTGTPIQNSMQELWALLHFIMPSLFDSHEEFSEWFSRDIENHAENSGALDQHQLSRLHMILKPFMLRRVKKNVQHELGEKIELEVMCQLTPRQRQLYSTLREKISLSELLEKSKSSLDNKSVESLLNLVIQFRKVCNHPELFERAEVRSPLVFCRFPHAPPVGDFPYVPYNSQSHVTQPLPRLVYREGGLLDIPGPEDCTSLKLKIINNDLNLWSIQHLHSIRFQPDGGVVSLTGLSPGEMIKSRSRLIPFLHDQCLKEDRKELFEYYQTWTQTDDPVSLKSPQVLLQAIRAHKEMISVADSFSDQFLGLRIKGCYQPNVVAPSPRIYCSDHHQQSKQHYLYDRYPRSLLLGLSSGIEPTSDELIFSSSFSDKNYDDSHIAVPPAAKLIMNSGKLMALDKLLTRLKAEGHRVLLYSQMTKMIDLMEEYLTYRQHSYLRLDGSSKISDRRDLVDDWQTRPDLFVFLLSTRAGGLGINLTAADTVIFYDSDWNPTVDQQAMDRAHRLGQTKQVTVYRLVTRGTIEERILQRAKQKDAIHRVVIAGGDFKAPELKSKEIFSLLLDDAQLSPQAPKSPVILEVGDLQPPATEVLSNPASPTQPTIAETTIDSEPSVQPEVPSVIESVAELPLEADAPANVELEIQDHSSITSPVSRRPPTSIADLLGPSDEELSNRSRASSSKHEREDDSDSQENAKKRFLSL